MVGKSASLTLAEEWGDGPPRTQIVMIASHGGLDVEGAAHAVGGLYRRGSASRCSRAEERQNGVDAQEPVSRIRKRENDERKMVRILTCP